MDSNADSVPTYSAQDGDSSYCRNCGGEIVFDGAHWWHDEDPEEDEPCFDGNLGPEPETLHGIPTITFNRTTGHEWRNGERVNG